MCSASNNPVLENVRRSLERRPQDALAGRPAGFPPRLAASEDEEITLLCSEIEKLSGVARRLEAGELAAALEDLVRQQEVRKATLWPTPGLISLQIEERLQALGVEIISPHSDKQLLAQCDLGVTEVDFALPETGTLALLSSPEKPRPVSLLPRIHLAILRRAALRADLHQVFAEAKSQPYLVFITGPSRTADIELTLTLGVHGPKALVVWMLVD